MPTSTIQEYASSAGQSLRVDRDQGVIQGVKVIGLVSKNGRTYTAQCLAKALPLYEGAPCFVDHGAEGKSRSYRDRIGRLQEVSARADGLYANLHYNKKHALAEQLAEDAEHAPANVGLSHVVEATTAKKDGKVIVEEIHKVNSVDLVAVPATTASLFEGENVDPQHQEFAEHGLSAVSDARSIILGDASLEEKKTRLTEVLAAWRAELTGDSTKEIQAMDFKDLTVESLKANRPDLVAVLVPDAALRDQVKALTEQLAAKETAAQEVANKLALIEAEKAKQAKTIAVAEELKAAKLDASDKLAVSDAFMEVLMAAPDEAARKRLIEDRVAVFVGRRPAGSGSAPMGTVDGGANGGGGHKIAETKEELVARL